MLHHTLIRPALTIALAAAVCLVVCAPPRALAHGRAKTVTIDDGDNNNEVNLNPGDTLVIKLNSNASTNYSWNVAQNDASLLRPLDSNYVRPRGKLIGASGTQVFRFKAVGSGGTELILLYQNPSLKGVRAAKQYRVLVTINRPGQGGSRVGGDGGGD